MAECTDPNCPICHSKDAISYGTIKYSGKPLKISGSWIPSENAKEAMKIYDEAWEEDPWDAPEEQVRVKYNRTLAIIKPDAIERRIVSKVYKRLEATGLHLRAMELKQITIPEAESLYTEHSFESFFNDLVEFMSSAPSIVMVWEGDKAAAKIRAIIGNKHPSDSPKGTIRGDLGGEYPQTIIHGSDPWSAKREVEIFFSQEDLV